MGKVGRAGDGPLPQGIPDEVKVGSSLEKPADVKSNDIPAETQKRPSESLAKEGSGKILEGKIQGMLKESVLRTDADKAAGNQPSRMKLKEEIIVKREEINSKIQSAMETKEKVDAHLSGLQQEIQELRTQLKELRKQGEQIKNVPGDVRNPNSQKGQLAQELEMKERLLDSKLNDLIDQTQSVMQDAVKELTGVNPSLDTSGLRNASPETKLKALEGLNRDLGDLVNGTSNAGKVVVKIGGSEVTAQGLSDYIAKLQRLERQLHVQQRKLDE